MAGLYILNEKAAKSIFAQAFGYAASGILTNASPTTRYGTDLYKKDKYGVSCFAPVTLKYGNTEVFLPYSTVSVTTSKTIVRTKLINRKGSVKEHISGGDYIITIRGVLINREQELPEDEIEQIKELYNTQEPIGLINAITDFFLDADDKVIVRSLTLPEMIGMGEAQAFTLDCETDSNLDLIIE